MPNCRGQPPSERVKRLTTYVDKGMVDTMLPYTQQDFYDRQRKMRMFKGIYLENDHL